jgi:hypothetical protein
VKRCRLLAVGFLVGFLANGHSWACLRQAYLGVHQTGSSPGFRVIDEAISEQVHGIAIVGDEVLDRRSFE